MGSPQLPNPRPRMMMPCWSSSEVGVVFGVLYGGGCETPFGGGCCGCVVIVTCVVWVPMSVFVCF